MKELLQRLEEAKQKVIPMGMCFQYVFDEASRVGGTPAENRTKFYHATVDPRNGEWGEVAFPGQRKYSHAWFERDGMAYDWQMMEAHWGGPKYSGKGMPADLFRKVYIPSEIREYTAEEIVLNSFRNRHKGPW